MKELPVFALFQAISNGARPLLIDVRQTEELVYGTLPDALHFPLQELPSRIEELRGKVDAAGKERMVVVYCRVGGRSERAIRYLEGNGFPELYNLTGGTNAYSEIDQSVSEY